MRSQKTNSNDLENQHADLAPIVFGMIQNPNQNRTKTAVFNVRTVRKK